MEAGRLRNRIELQEPTVSQDAIGGASDTWSTAATVWAEVSPVQGREFFAAQQVKSEVTHRIKIRYRAGITTRMRVKFGERIFDIESVINWDERNRELHLMAVERVTA